jgi:DNA replication protein DnaC
VAKQDTADRGTREALKVYLRTLKLPGFSAYHADVGAQAEAGGWTFQEYLRHLCELELQDRRRRRIDRLQRQSSLPREKTLATLDQSRLPTTVRRQIPTLCTGEFVEKAQNVLAFGLPGRGKTHALCAVGHELVQRGMSVLFVAAFQLVQRLLVAKRDLRLEAELKRLDAFDVVLVDDIGYVQQSRDEMEVLFTFLAERYERKSVMITSNLVFSQWDRIFKDAMTTAAAIDRLVHHAIILELSGASYRTDAAKARLEAALPADQAKVP